MFHGCIRIEQHVCGMELVIEELFYPKEAANQQTYATSLDLGDKLAERILVEFQDTPKVTQYYVNDLGGNYSMSKTTPKEKEQGYGIRTNNNPYEGNFAISRDVLSQMGNASVYVASAESQFYSYNQSLKNPPEVPSHCFPVTVLSSCYIHISIAHV